MAGLSPAMTVGTVCAKRARVDCSAVWYYPVFFAMFSQRLGASTVKPAGLPAPQRSVMRTPWPAGLEAGGSDHATV
jgi:hypothetical protein